LIDRFHCDVGCRQLPEGTGWVLDGYPMSVAQAVLLEKAVSGYDASRSSVVDPDQLSSQRRSVDSKKPLKKSELVSDARPAPPAPPPVSGLDAVIVLEMTDDQCLLRAADLQRQSLVSLSLSLSLLNSEVRSHRIA